MLARLAGWLPAPPLASNIDGHRVTLAWKAISGADGYYLFYAPYPFRGVDTIQNADMQGTTTISADVPSHFAYFVAIKAYNTAGSSDFSNIELIVVD